MDPSSRRVGKRTVGYVGIKVTWLGGVGKTDGRQWLQIPVKHGGWPREQ